MIQVSRKVETFNDFKVQWFIEKKSEYSEYNIGKITSICSNRTVEVNL